MYSVPVRIQDHMFESSIRALFDNVSNYFESKDPVKGYSLSFNLSEGAVTFQQLNALSEIIQSDSIDLVPATEGVRYSSVTYESGSPTQIRCWGIPV